MSTFIRKYGRLALLAAALSASFVAQPVLADSWTNNIELRDDSGLFPNGKPAGGWWVAPIHATLLTDGKVLISGWGRRDHDNCGMGGTRLNGTSFILDPNALPASGTLNIQPLPEAQLAGTSDVIYCAGHVPMADGRVLFTGGSRYEYLGNDALQQEYGLNYARVYSPSTNTFSRVTTTMKGGLTNMEGQAWYPTNTRMPDGKVLVIGGFARCCNDAYVNRTVQTFDPVAQTNGQDPWTQLASHANVPSDLGPGIRDYVHTFLLPQTISVNGMNRSVAMVGANGRIVYMNTDAGVSESQRFTYPINNQRANAAAAWDSTAALTSTGEIMMMGGTDNNATAQKVDLFQPSNNTWRSIDTGIGRRNASSVLLPDGNVLLINGGTDERAFAGDRRQPQILNPKTGAITTLPAWPNDSRERGYHNFAILLKDGRVLIGGGISPIGGIGCERPDVRIYSPNYLTAGTRPVLTGAPATMAANGAAVTMTVSSETLKASADGGVVLLATGSTTHSFDQNQRYVRLNYTRSGNTLTVSPPSSNQEAPVGDYLMFAVSSAGVPSVGVPVKIQPEAAASGWKRTVVFIFGQTNNGQDMFVRGGIGHEYAAASLGKTCTQANMLCAIPIKHRNLKNATTNPWKPGDNNLDWYGFEGTQSTAAQGTPLDWTTNLWPTSWGTKRTVDVDGYGETPLNTYGDNYWMLDVDMDCSKTVNGWFELKSFITNGPGWEADVTQPGAPYASKNHMAQCGKKNMFLRGSGAATITALP